MKTLSLPIEVKLSRREQLVAIALGKVRQRQNEQAGVEDRRTATRIDPSEMHVQGVAAEFAFCKAANLWPDLDPHPQQGTFDCYLPSGVSVDVKGSTYPHSNLLVPLSVRKNAEHADIYVLVTGELKRGKDGSPLEDTTTFVVVGWAWAEETFRSTTGNFKKACYFLPKEELKTVLPLTQVPKLPAPRVVSA